MHTKEPDVHLSEKIRHIIYCEGSRSDSDDDFEDELVSGALTL